MPSVTSSVTYRVHPAEPVALSCTGSLGATGLLRSGMGNAVHRAPRTLTHEQTNGGRRRRAADSRVDKIGQIIPKNLRQIILKVTVGVITLRQDVLDDNSFRRQKTQNIFRHVPVRTFRGERAAMPRHMVLNHTTTALLHLLQGEGVMQSDDGLDVSSLQSPVHFVRPCGFFGVHYHLPRAGIGPGTTSRAEPSTSRYT